MQGRSTLFGWLAIGAVSYHAVAMGFLHRLAPEVDPLSDMVSAYLGSHYQLLSRSTFLALGCAFAFLGLGLLGRIKSSAWVKVSTPLLVLAIIGFLGVAISPQNARFFGVPTQPATVVSILFLSIALRQEAVWRPVGAVLIMMGVLLAALFVLTIVLGVLVTAGFGGLANRVVLILIYAWVVLVAWKMLATQDRAIGA